MLIALTNTKGGVGKSTLAAHLAIWLHDRGVRVALLDTDEQQTAAKWVRGAEPAITVVVAADADSIQKERTSLLKSHEFVVADSPGNKSESAHAITMLADLAIVPLQPSKPDVREVKNALTFVRLAREMSGGKRPEVFLVVTFSAKADVQTRKLRSDLAAVGFPVARCEIRRLNALRDACDTAVTRMSSREGMEAAKDINALFEELLADRLPAAKVSNKKVANG